MKDEQSEKLRALFEHARRSTTYYANHLPNLSSSLPVDPLDLLNLVVPLSRKELQQERVRLYSISSETSSWRVSRTTGTTGEPAEVVLDSRARRVEAEVITDHFEQLAIDDVWRERDLMHLVLHPGATSRAIPTPWSTSRIAKWNLIRAWQASDSRFLKSLQYLNGNIVTAMPSVAELLCSRIQDAASESIRPLLVLLSGEAVEPKTQAQVAKVFGCLVSSLYVITEAGIVGTGCPDKGGYHVAEQNVYLEIIDADGKAALPEVEGEVLVTPLENYAMPLLRYCTGDRGRWEADSCTCSNIGPRLTLTSVRRPIKLATASGLDVSIIRFAKLLSSLNLKRYGFSQEPDGSVTISYAAARQLDAASRSLIVSTVRNVIGLDSSVNLRHVLDADEVVEGVQLPRAAGPRDKRIVEPEGVDAAAIQKWLKQRLRGRTSIECALLTGSALDVESSSRFSDIDLIIMVQDEPSNPHWLELSQKLRMELPSLSVNIDQLAGLSRRAPLTACRLLQEQLPVIGELDAAVLSWPCEVDLKAQGRLWAQEAFAVLWHRLTSPERKANDPVREAWIASKYGLNALRYHYLSRGERSTVARDIIARALQDHESMPWLDELIESFDVARELRPPPVPTVENVRRHFAAALSCVRFVSRNF